ncbi:MAG: GNAT family N-acetyltransferase [Hyphomonadaceae bacterium]
MRHVKEIETDRLRLRRMRVEDGARISLFTSDYDVARMTSRIPHPHPPVAAEGFVLIMRARESLGRDHVFAIDLKGEGLIGLIGAHQGEGARHEIGYWIGRPHWSKGFATEALSAFLRKARGLGQLEAGHFADNPASGRVLEKNGFVYTGETKPLFSMARGGPAPCRRMVLADDPEAALEGDARQAAHA